MSACPVPRIADCFHDLVDPRIERTKRHQLLDVVTIALCAVLAGAESWVEVAEWGEIKLPWLRTWLKLPNGIPSHEYCDRLSAERAKAVADFLNEKGIPRERLQYKGYGKRQPVDSNRTQAGRQKNQRVEIKILSFNG